MSMKGRTALAAAAILWAGAAVAQDATAPGRYAMSEVEGGILRLDTQTGDVSFCRNVEEQWICNTAADDRAVLDDEISRLEDENRSLRQRLAELERQNEEQEQHTLTLPNDEELDKVIGFMERLMRRFYAFTRSLGSGEPGEQT